MAKTYDLKVGFACNNNCLHCVVKPYIGEDDQLNLSYFEIISKIKENILPDTRLIVLTGGEITIRKDFERIISFIKTNYSGLEINIQTNGRLLWKHLDFLSQYQNISYTLAIHSHDEETHNFIVNNKIKTDNPFQETLKTLKMMSEFENMRKSTRIEIVLSKYNLKDIAKTLEFCNDLGFKRVGISYPHLDGYEMKNPAFIKEISFPINKMVAPFYEVYEFLCKTPDMYLSLESIPKCVFRNPKTFEPLPISSNIHLKAYYSENKTQIDYPNGKRNDFVYNNCFKKAPICAHCSNNDCCIGVWSDAVNIWGNEMFNII